MRILLLIAVVGLVLSTWGEWEYASPLRWDPLDERPMPKPKSVATFEFWSASGNFYSDVELPMSKEEESRTMGSKMDSKISCDLVFELYYAGGEQISSLKVNTLRQWAAIYSSHIDCYDGGTIGIPKIGHYTLKVRNLGADSALSSGHLSLISQENTETAAVLAGVLRILMGIFAGIIVLIGIVKAIKHWRLSNH